MLDVKRLISHFTYRIEPKPEGGFVARASDPSVPPLEAPTREELQQKIQANISATLAAEFPELKLPLDGKTNFSFHIEHHPSGGFSFQSTDGQALPLTGSTHAEIENQFAERVAGMLGKILMPGMAQALSQQGSADVQVVVNGKTMFSRNSTSSPTGEVPGSIPAGIPGSPPVLNPDGSPLVAEKNKLWPIVRFLLAAVALVVVLYFIRHH